jgi:hypothetical protein
LNPKKYRLFQKECTIWQNCHWHSMTFPRQPQRKMTPPDCHGLLHHMTRGLCHP